MAATALREETGSVLVVASACSGCGACLPTCPTAALRKRPGGILVVDDRCTGCWECIEICPTGAIETGRDGPR